MRARARFYQKNSHLSICPIFCLKKTTNLSENPRKNRTNARQKIGQKPDKKTGHFSKMPGFLFF